MKQFDLRIYTYGSPDGNATSAIATVVDPENPTAKPAVLRLSLTDLTALPALIAQVNAIVNGG